jgi:hypothetical protein
MDFTNAIPSNNGKPPGGIHNFDTAEPAPEYSPVPPGVYIARVRKGEYTTTQKGKEAYRMRFEVIEGPHTGKSVFRTWTFGTKALPYTKRDLTLFGLTSFEKLLSPFPEPGRDHIVRLVVALQRKDDGREFNEVKKIDIIRVDGSPAAAFMIPPPPTAQPEKSEGGTPPGSLFRADRPGMLPD